jgi:hypothetical protein
LNFSYLSNNHIILTSFIVKMARKMAPTIVETLNPNDSDDEHFNFETVTNPEGHLGQDMQHSHATNAELQDSSESEDNDEDSDKKPAATPERPNLY